MIFDGEYLNGKKWKGKYKDYINNSSIIFESEYLNGEINGKGKEYYYNNLIFEDEYLNGQKNGKGKEYFNNKVIFEGEFLNGKRWNVKGKDYEKYEES